MNLKNYRKNQKTNKTNYIIIIFVKYFASVNKYI